jgi:hypothetical protein
MKTWHLRNLAKKQVEKQDKVVLTLTPQNFLYVPFEGDYKINILLLSPLRCSTSDVDARSVVHVPICQ